MKNPTHTAESRWVMFGVNEREEGMYLYKRGRGARNRVMHLPEYDRRGNCVGAACKTKLELNTSCNLPLGLPICKKCRRAFDA